jgi:acyl-ACP thioesterase
MGHVNNAAYLDWVEEGLLNAEPPPGEVAQPSLLDRLPRRSRLEYLASAAPGDGIVVSTDWDGSRWSSRIARSRDDVELLRGTGTVAADGLGSIEGVPPRG